MCDYILAFNYTSLLQHVLAVCINYKVKLYQEYKRLSEHGHDIIVEQITAAPEDKKQNKSRKKYFEF